MIRESQVQDLWHLIKSLIIVTTLIYKIPPTLPLPALGRKNISKGEIPPLWQRGARGDFPTHMPILF
jgi:hypothetical protein